MNSHHFPDCSFEYKYTILLELNRNIGSRDYKDSPLHTLVFSSFDPVVFKFINGSCASPILDHIMLLATWFGEGVVQTGICLALIIAGLIWDLLNFRKAGYAGLTAYALSGIFAQVGKHIWNRPRPLLVYFDVRIVDKPLFTHSFPSGHTVTAFAAAFAMGAFLPKWKYFLIPIAILTAISRVYLGVHFPTDVLFGAFIGAFTGMLSAKIYSKPHEIVPNDIKPVADGN